MLVFLLGFGCTRLIHFYDECETDAECAQAVGSGAICMTNGYCSSNVSTVDTGDTDIEDTDIEDTDTEDTETNEPCTTHRECRVGNGLGFMCNDDGTCSGDLITALPDRCVTHPSDAFDNWSAYSNAHIIGAIADSSLERPAQLAIELATEELNEGLDDQQVVTFLCDNRNDLQLTRYFDNLDSTAATQLVSSFLMTELHAPVVVGPGFSDKVKVAMESSIGSDSVVISTAGGDGLTQLNQDDRIWSSVGDDQHRLQTLMKFISTNENYSYSVILFDHPELLSCDAGPNGAMLYGCQLSDGDNILIPDELQNLLYGLNSPMYESLIFPYDMNYPAVSQLWYEYFENRPSAPTAIVFVSDNLNTNIDFVERVLPSVSLDAPNTDIYFTQYALQSSFIDAVPTDTSYFYRGFAPMFDDMGTLFGRSSSGFYQRFYDATNGMDALDNPQSVFVYDSMMLSYLAVLHSDKAGNKGSGADISNMLKTFKSFDDAGFGGDEFSLTPEGIQDSLEVNSDGFRIVGLSGQVRYTSDQDASLSSLIWEVGYGELTYMYGCENTLSVLQDMAIGCGYE